MRPAFCARIDRSSPNPVSCSHVPRHSKQACPLATPSIAATSRMPRSGSAVRSAWRYKTSQLAPPVSRPATSRGQSPALIPGLVETEKAVPAHRNQRYPAERKSPYQSCFSSSANGSSGAVGNRSWSRKPKDCGSPGRMSCCQTRFIAAPCERLPFPAQSMDWLEGECKALRTSTKLHGSTAHPVITRIVGNEMNMRGNKFVAKPKDAIRLAGHH